MGRGVCDGLAAPARVAEDDALAARRRCGAPRLRCSVLAPLTTWSAGKRSGTSGSKIGNAHLKWAISEAAVLMLRHGDVEKLRNRLHRKHGKGKAMGVLTHKLGRTIYYMLLRKKPFDLERFLAA
jgi:transposase